MVLDEEVLAKLQIILRWIKMSVPNLTIQKMSREFQPHWHKKKIYILKVSRIHPLGTWLLTLSDLKCREQANTVCNTIFTICNTVIKQKGGGIN